MNILFVVPYAPTPIRVRPYQLIRHLARRGHQVTVATLWSTAEERAGLVQLPAQGLDVIARRLPLGRSLWNCLRALPGPIPLQAVYCWQPALAQAIDRQARGSTDSASAPDVVHVEHLRGARYGLWLKRRPAGAGPPLVWDSVDCISHLFAQAAQHSRSLKNRLMTQWELPRTRRYEAQLLTQFDRVLVTSPADQAALQALIPFASRPAGRPPAPVAVLPNGVDLDYFAPTDEPRQPATVAFSGKMSYHANVAAALHLVQDIMPLVWAQNPAVQVWIVGKDPSRQVLQLAQRHSPQVTVTGVVPDIRPHLRRAALAVAPVVYGAGIQNKVLEAMACAAPVIASPQAVSALSTRPGRDLLVAADARAFAEDILALLADPEHSAQLGRQGRSFVARHHAWGPVAEQLEGIYRQAIQARRPPAA